MGKDEITMKDLEQRFTTPAFKGVFDKGTPLYDFLVNLPRCNEEKMHVNSIACLGLLFCTGTNEQKADAFF